MSLGTANRDGGKTSESGHLRAIMKGYLGQVLSGLNVSQRGAGANMSVDIAVGDAIIPRSDGTYGHPAFNDAVLNQVITTADPSNPRRDILVMYIDYANAVSTGVSNNTNGVVKVKVVAGTPAGSPVDPTNAAIQSSVGASNPYIKLSRIRVGTGVTSIGNSVIDDLRVMASGMLQGGWNYDAVNPWVYVSASSFKVAGLDVTAQFPVGTKIQLYQGSVVAYFVVTAAVFGTDTTVTVDGRGTYSLANNIIDKPAYSYDLRPQNYPWSGAPVLYRRQGGTTGDNSWQTPGTSNTDTSGKPVFVQAGVGTIAGGETVVTFPVPFNQIPIVVGAPNTATSQNTSFRARLITTTGFTAILVFDGTAATPATNENFGWVAYGQ